MEISPFLRQVQEQNLCGTTSVLEQEESNRLSVHSSLTKLGFPITWYPDLDSIPETSGFTLYVCHEFLGKRSAELFETIRNLHCGIPKRTSILIEDPPLFLADALPIHKFRKNENGEWREILVDYETPSSANSKENLRYVLSRSETPASKAYIPPTAKEQDYEVCPDALVFMQKIVQRLNNNAGLFLGIDYGYSEQLQTNINRDTFRAFREHALWHPLEKPGTFSERIALLQVLTFLEFKSFNHWKLVQTNCPSLFVL